MSPRFPPQFPPVWAVAWGDDPFGLWAELVVYAVVQRLRWIEPGEFLMGSPDDEPGRSGNEGPQHRVWISEGFWLADSPCTQVFWLAVTGDENPSGFADSSLNPVEHVSWDDVQIFLQRMAQRLPEGSEPVLPSEAQWEYACRAGTQTPFNLGETISPEQVNCNDNLPYANADKGAFRERTVPVKSLAPNGWGLYEMHGNVREWCADGLRDYSNVGAGEVVVDPMGPTESALRAVRGGSWIDEARRARSAYRGAGRHDFRDDDLGFRLALRS